MSTTEEAKTESKEDSEVEGKKAGDDAPPTHLGWNTHQPVVRF